MSTTANGKAHGLTAQHAVVKLVYEYACRTEDPSLFTILDELREINAATFVPPLGDEALQQLLADVVKESAYGDRVAQLLANAELPIAKPPGAGQPTQAIGSGRAAQEPLARRGDDR